MLRVLDCWLSADQILMNLEGKQGMQWLNLGITLESST